MMGSITTVDEELRLRLAATHMRLGFGVGANDVELVLRSLPSIALRYAAHDGAGRALAKWWQQRPEVCRHPGFDLAGGQADHRPYPISPGMLSNSSRV